MTPQDLKTRGEDSSRNALYAGLATESQPAVREIAGLSLARVWRDRTYEGLYTTNLLIETLSQPIDGDAEPLHLVVPKDEKIPLISGHHGYTQTPGLVVTGNIERIAQLYSSDIFIDGSIDEAVLSAGSVIYASDRIDKIFWEQSPNPFPFPNYETLAISAKGVGDVFPHAGQGQYFVFTQNFSGKDKRVLINENLAEWTPEDMGANVKILQSEIKSKSTHS